MSRSSTIRKNSNIDKISLYSLAMMPSEDQVRGKMEEYSKKKTGRTLMQLSLGELYKAKEQVNSTTESLIESELSGLEKMMLGGDGIAEGKRLANKILDEEIAKRPKSKPVESEKQKPKAPVIEPVEKPVANVSKKEKVLVEPEPEEEKDYSYLILHENDLKILSLEYKIRRLERKDPSSPLIDELTRAMPNSPRRKKIVDLSDRDLESLYKEHLLGVEKE